MNQVVELPVHAQEPKLGYPPALCGTAPTTHLVFAIVMALAAANAQRRRGFGAHRVDSLEARMVVFRQRAIILVVGNHNLGAAGEWVSDRHGCRAKSKGGRYDVDTVTAGCNRRVRQV